MSTEIKPNYSPDAKVAKRLDVHIKTIKRWDRRPALGFPKPIIINGRTYRDNGELDAFLLRAAVAHAKTTP
jgi:hypothetical protein